MKILLKLIILVCILILFLPIFIISQTEHFTQPDKINVWVINLDKDSDRLEKFKRYFKTNGNDDVNMIRYPAVLGKNVSEDDDIYKKYISRDFKEYYNREATIGCALSHASLLNKLYEEYKNDTNQKFFIICEDDAIIKENFSKNLKTILNELPSDWDFVYLGSSKAKGTKYSEHLMKPSFSNGGMWGFFGYMVSHSGLEKIVDNLKEINKPIDNFLKDKGLNYFLCSPSLITHDFDNVSNLTGKNRTDESGEYNKITVIT